LEFRAQNRAEGRKWIKCKGTFIEVNIIKCPFTKILCKRLLEYEDFQGTAGVLWSAVLHRVAGGNKRILFYNMIKKEKK
jgi:hypothetical protein